MSISSEITRIATDKTTIRNKFVNLGIATATDNLDALALAADRIENRGAPSAEVKEGEQYAILPGYYSGGSVAGVSGGGNYKLQSKSITPTKSQQSVAPDSGFYGLSSVTVGAIPDNYQDVSVVTATASDVLANKIIIASDGTTTPGTMPNNGTVTRTLDATTGNQSYTIPTGYHSGSGSVSITLETKTASPNSTQQTITPTAGKVLSSVVVEAIPEKYGDVTNADVEAGDIVSGKKALGNVNGVATMITGSMPDIGAISGTIDGLTVTSYSISAGKTSGGTVSLTNDIELALAAI